MSQNVNNISGKYSINPDDLEFFRLCFKYHDKYRAYKETHPDCTDNDNSIRTMSCRLYTSIYDKFQGNIRDMLEAAGLGAGRLTDEIEKGLNAMKTEFYKGQNVAECEDNATRARTRELLARVSGYDNKTVEVHKEPGETLDLSKLSEEQLAKFHELLSIAKSGGPE